jgi:hypothetical protein
MAEPIGDATARIVSMVEAKSKAGGRKRPATKPKPAPRVLPDGKHFSRCPAAGVFDPNLTDGEVRGLAAAGAFTDKHGTCRASQSAIARRLGVSRQTVHRWFAALVAAGYLRLVRKTKKANGADGMNVYQLVYPPLAKKAPEPPQDLQVDGGRYPPSQNSSGLTSDVPSAIAPRQPHG